MTPTDEETGSTRMTHLYTVTSGIVCGAMIVEALNGMLVGRSVWTYMGVGKGSFR